MDILVLACPPTPQIEALIGLGEKVTSELGGKVTALCIRSDIAKRFYSPFSIELEDVDEEEEERAFQRLKEVSDEVKKIKRGGELVSSVLDEVERGEYDMLIFEDMDLHITKKIVTHTNIPVLVIRREVVIKKVLTCTDGSDNARMSCLLGSRIAKALGAEVTMLSVAPEFMDEEFARECDLACGMIAKEKAGVEPKSLCKAGKGVKSVREEILKEATNHDLVVCGSRGLSAMERVLMGHVSLEILEKADTNVLIVRGYDE